MLDLSDVIVDSAPDNAPSVRPCIDGTRHYNVSKCKPARCQAPIGQACRDRIAVYQGDFSRVRGKLLRCCKCQERWPLNQFPTAAYGNQQDDVYLCDTCREERRKETERKASETYRRKKLRRAMR